MSEVDMSRSDIYYPLSISSPATKNPKKINAFPMYEIVTKDLIINYKKLTRTTVAGMVTHPNVAQICSG
jgi:hypothetical protein